MKDEDQLFFKNPEGKESPVAELSPEEQTKKNIKLHKYHILADVFLIIVLLGLGAYIILNLESFKTLSKDVCAYCMEKTGAICSQPFVPYS